MKAYLAILLAMQLLLCALGAVKMDAPAEPPEDAGPEPVPAAEHIPLPAELTGLEGVLERIGAEYDPAAAGSVGAIRWAGTLLDGYAADGQDPAAAEAAASEYIARHADGDALESRLLRLRLAALQLCSGEDLGLVREPGRRQSAEWTAETVEKLFTALFRGAGLPLPE